MTTSELINKIGLTKFQNVYILSFNGKKSKCSKSFHFGALKAKSQNVAECLSLNQQNVFGQATANRCKNSKKKKKLSTTF